MSSRATSSILAGLAAGLGLPPVFHLLLRHGAGPSAAAAAAAGLAVLGGLAGGAFRGPTGLLAGGAGVLLSGLIALPGVGVRLTLAAALTSAAASLIFGLRRPAGEDTPGGPAPAFPPQSVLIPAVLLAAAAAAGWTRLETLLIGNWAYGLCLTLSALLLGAGAGSWAGPKAAARLGDGPAADDGPAPEGSALAAAGLLGVLGLPFTRFIGLNAGSGEFLQAPLRGPADALFLMGQPFLLVASWSFLAAAALSALAVRRPSRSPALALALLASAGPFAGMALTRVSGPEAAIAVNSVLLMLLGLAAAGAGRLWRAPVLSKAAAAAVALGLWAGAANQGIMRDVWTNRLDEAFPGGEFLFLRDDGDESLGAYRFASGVTIALEDGVAVFHEPLTLARFTRIPLLARDRAAGAPAPRVLFLGVRDPRALAEALASGVSARAVDPHPGYPELLRRLGQDAPALEGLAVADGLLRQRPSPRGWDIIFLEPPAPLDSTKSSLALTEEALRDLAAGLAPDGILAVLLTTPCREAWLIRTLATAGESFPHALLIELSGRRLLLASDRPLPKPVELVSRLPAPLKLDEAELIAFREEGDSWSSDRLRSCPNPGVFTAEGAGPGTRRGLVETDDRPRNAFPLAEILSSGPSVAR
ncbi:MAG: hypothetical protein WC943_10710 [Elusimicrobiota bacterium]|jgi:hypothetical protein